MTIEDDFAESIARLVYKILQHPAAPVARVMHGTFLNDNAVDANLCDISLIDGSVIPGVPRIGTQTFHAGQSIIIMTGPAMPLMVVGPIKGNVQSLGIAGLIDPLSPLDLGGQLVTKTYNFTAFGSYKGNSLVTNQLGTGSFTGKKYIMQGTSSVNPDFYYRSLMYIPYATIQSDFTFANSTTTVQSCSLNFRFDSWYSGSGTAVWGTHNSTASSAPSTYPTTGYSPQYRRLQSTAWNNLTTRIVNLGEDIGQEFVDGTTKGLAIGPTTSGDPKKVYGYGHWNLFVPTLTITAVVTSNLVL